jgi:signal peptidase II
MPSRFSETLLSPAALCRFVLTTAVGLMLDLWTKNLAVEQLKSTGRVVDFIHGWLQFEYIENPGAVFGIAPGKTGMFIAVSILAVAFLTYLFSTSAGKWFYQIILGLLLAGVLGNMYDRIEIGQVRDMIHGLPGWHWPGGVRHVLKFLPYEVFPYIFNVADMLLCTGVGLMLIYSFFNTGDQTKASQQVLPAEVK